MKANYTSPKVEIIELEIENAVLGASVGGNNNAAPGINGYSNESAW